MVKTGDLPDGNRTRALLNIWMGPIRSIYTFASIDRGEPGLLIRTELYVNQSCEIQVIALINKVTNNGVYNYRKSCSNSACTEVVFDPINKQLKFDNISIPYQGGATYGAEGPATLSGTITW